MMRRPNSFCTPGSSFIATPIAGPCLNPSFSKSRALSIATSRYRARRRAVTRPAAFLILLIVLARWSDPHSVQGHADYILLFLCGGGLWVFAAPLASSVLGVSARQDAVERDSVPAGVAVSGAMLGAIAV